MKYVKLGKTGLNASRLGFGCMRLPYKGDKPDHNESLRLLNIAFDYGVNYYDTAPLYCDGESEEIVGKFISQPGKRGKVILSTKNNGRDNETWKEHFERSFKRLNTDYIDIYHAWAMDLAAFKKVSAKGGPLELLYKAKKEGRVRHAAFSFHDASPGNVKEVIDSGLFESMLLSFNVLKRENAEWLQYADKKGLATLVMNPVAGGNLSGHARLALKYVFNQPFIDVALSGMNSSKQVDENCQTAAEDWAFSPEEKTLLEKAERERKALLDLYCTGCGYCKGCPAGIDIAGTFKIYNEAVIGGSWHLMQAQKLYRDGGETAKNCAECGACMKKCPQKLNIIEHLKKCHKSLGTA